MLELARAWTVNQRRFMEWLALPPTERMPVTQAMLARELEVHELTLTRWRKIPGFNAEVQAIITANLGDALPEVMGAFKAEAKKGSFQHQKMYFEMLGIFTQKEQIELSGGIGIAFYLPLKDGE